MFACIEKFAQAAKNFKHSAEDLHDTILLGDLSVSAV